MESRLHHACHSRGDVVHVMLYGHSALAATTRRESWHKHGMCLSHDDSLRRRYLCVRIFSSWLIQRYRRNKVFCISALCLGLTIATMFVLTDRTAGFTVAIRDVEAIAIFLTCGFFFGNAKRVLSCTLLIDKPNHATERRPIILQYGHHALPSWQDRWQPLRLPTRHERRSSTL